MSKGGAGKVYFVLYLAVILELLIIFIERDEAEEGLRRKQKEAIEIVQTILSQLQTGNGATGITTIPKDEIVLEPKDQKGWARNYKIFVSVGDSAAKQVINGKEIAGDDISSLQYSVSLIPNPNLDEGALGPDTTDIEGGQQILLSELGTDVGSYTQPRQISGTSIPTETPESYFTINDSATQDMLAKGKRIKVFNVNFKPTKGQGWYRLRFHTNTNKIMTVAQEPSDNDTVRVGNIKFAVKQLRLTKRFIEKQGDKAGVPGSGATVISYIDKLLTPNAANQFEENQSATSFNIRVKNPPPVPIQKPQDPVAAILMARDTAYWYDAAPFEVQVKLGPKDASSKNVSGATLTVLDASAGIYNATIDKPQSGGITPIVATASTKAGTQTATKYLMVEKPTLRNSPDRWKGNRAVIGRKYNPTSEWMSGNVPNSHYQTVVEINGEQALNQEGTVFKEAELAANMKVTESTKSVKTTVYWKPNGVADKSKWVALLTNDKNGSSIIKPTKDFQIVFPSPEQTDGFEAEWVINSKKLTSDVTTITVSQRLGDNSVPAEIQGEAGCSECSTYGLTFRLVGGDGGIYTLSGTVSDIAVFKKNIAGLQGKRFEIGFTIRGRGGVSSQGTTFVTVRAIK